MSLTTDLETALMGALAGFKLPTFAVPESAEAVATLPTPAEPEPEPTSPRRRRSSRAPFRRWDRVDTVTITHNVEKGGIEIKFPGKPPIHVIDALKRHGFRWNPGSGCWWKRYSNEAEAIARRIGQIYTESTE